MTITTTRNTRRLGLASGAAAALLLLASACGTETAASQAPGSIRGPLTSSTEKQSPADREECLVAQAKHQDHGSACTESTQSPEVTQPQYLAPSGRPVPLPGPQG
jgi:hypothetical protein